MLDEPSSSPSLAKVVSKYRDSMAGCLQASLAEINDLLSPVDFDDIFVPIDQGALDDDPTIPFRRMSYLLVAKARLHVFAAILANKSDNMHSLAVQMRIAMECAGQVVSMFKNLYGKDPGAENRISRYINADYYQTAIRLSKGQIDRGEILKQINAAVPTHPEPVRKIKSFKESEKVKDLEFGDNWYGHLSDCFFHSDLPALKNHSYFGGISSSNTMFDEYGFAALLDYLAHQTMVMVMYAAMCPDNGLKDDKRFEKVAKLLKKEKGSFTGLPAEAHANGRARRIDDDSAWDGSMKSVQTREETIGRLRSGCEQCISCLNELVRVHLEMDPADRLIRADDEEIVYRLRKVLLHVKAITGWQLDTEVMHVLAPELRTAEEQMDLIWKKLPNEDLSEYLSDDGKSVVGGRDKTFKSGKEILSSYIHPTPQKLILGKEVGGLGGLDEVQSFINLFTLLSGLVFRYGVSLGFMCQLLSVKKEGPITSVLLKMTEAMGAISAAECLRFVVRESHGDGENTPGFAQ